MYLRWPLDDRWRTITSRFGVPSPFGAHKGVDISVVSGCPVYAAHPGVVRLEYTDGGGNTLRLEGNGIVTRYCHLSWYVAAAGQDVRQGDVIAASGNTGCLPDGASYAAHLHFELFLNEQLVDPLLYLEKEVATVTRHKLALHFQSYASWASSLVAQYWPLPGGWVKGIQTPHPDIFSNTHVLNRPWTRGDQDTWEREQVKQGAAGGHAIFAAQRWYYEELRGIATAHTFVNEPDLSNPQAARNYADALDAWNYDMHNVSLKTAGGSISNGNPKLKKFDGANAELQIIASALSRCDYWDDHCYWQRPYDPVDDWKAHRYRVIIEECKELGITLPPLLLGEIGADIGGGYYDGWRSQYNNDWGAFFVDLQRYAAELDRDSSVLAAFIFTSCPDSKWVNFEIDQAQAAEIGKWVANGAAPQIPTESLPEYETATEPAAISEKIRWWLEEHQRQIEAGNPAYAGRISLSLIKLGYRLETILKS